ncbi:hypothetical protein C9374_009444 [Naegleria lovaniensis]|uniref:Uncharacterized protein n=1 Tax=Naegleria lovaniensis TaxID=51637 RepID=A0AA88H4K9_NAELO|nr:uncharacterized protein C9374_009444 [Naegleria lovaniensis]KAG2392867.1 hypothetical protein C9374_009444 [Naegleria lovaniensis]
MSTTSTTSSPPSASFISQQAILRPFQSIPILLRNFSAIMGRSNFFPIDTQTFFKELFEALVVTLLYPVITFIGLYLQFLRWIWTMIFRVAVPTPQQYSAQQIKSAIITGVGSQSEIAKSLALSLCEQWRRDASQDHKMLTLVGNDDRRLNQIREDLLRTLGEDYPKTTEIRVKVCSLNDEEKIRQVVTEYDYDLVMTCQEEKYTNAVERGSVVGQQPNLVKEKTSPRSTSPKRDVKGSSVNGNRKGETNVPSSRSNEEASSSSSSTITSETSSTLNINPEQVQYPLNEDEIRSNYEFNIFGTLNTVLPAIRQSRERGLTDSPKHVVVVGNAPSRRGIDQQIFGSGPGFNSLLELSKLVEGEVRRSSLRSGLAGQKVDPNDFPNASQLVFQIVTPLICQNLTSTLGITFNEWISRVFSESYSSRRVEKRRQREGVQQDVTSIDESSREGRRTLNTDESVRNEPQSQRGKDQSLSEIPVQVADEIMRGVYRGVDVIDVNSPVVYAALRLYNAIPISVQHIISTLLQFNNE